MTTETIYDAGSQPPSDAPVSDSRPPRRNGWVALLVTLLGSVLVIGLVVQSVFVGISSSGATDHATYHGAVDGVTALDLDTSAADVTVRFDAVEEATLDVWATGWRRDVEWTLQNDNGVLRVSDDRRSWFWPTFGSSRTRAELVLPQELEGALAATLQVGAGSLEIEGDLGAVQIDISAGSLTFTGASTSLSAQVSAGEAMVTTSGAETIDVDVSAGRFVGTFTGPQPTTTSIGVSAGDAIVELPDGEYATTGDVSAGDRTIDVRTDPSSPNTLHVQVSAGSATVSYAD